MKSRFRWLRALLILIVLVVGGVCIAGWWLLSGSRAQLDGTQTVAGPQHPVTITRDALGTATITGQSRDDVTFALGYVHAQERFFPMDLMRRAAAGELSELVGSAALDTDIEHRRQRLRAVAEAAYAALPPEQKHTLDLYRDGVNAGLAHLRQKPWEYLLLQTQPQPWQSEDTLLVIGAMYLDLNGDGRNERQLQIAQIHAVLPDAMAQFLLSPDPNWEAPLKGDVSPSPTIPSADVYDLRRQPALTGASKLADANVPVDVAYPGSNSFAVAGNLSRSGAAILANDMHLSLRVPDIWFRARLRYPDPAAPKGQRDAVGVTLPGTPALVVGSNGQIAWGFTNSYGDWMDWVRVLRDPSDASRYKVPEGWASIDKHDELIRIKGAAPYHLEVDDTRWGPILAKDTDGTPLALSWIGNQPHGYNLTLMQLEHATSASAALDLAPTLGIPPQNFLVADSAGHIGWTIAGNSIPLRSGFDPGKPADWSQPNSGWTGWATPSQYPRIENPADGRLWTANNRTVGGGDLALLGNGGQDIGARAQQIREDLHDRADFGPGNMLDIQLDDHALFLTRWQQLLQQTLSDVDDPGLNQLRQLTTSWRNQAAPDSVDYRLVHAFRNEVHELVLAPFTIRIRQRFPDFEWPGPGNQEAAVWMLIQQQPANLLNPDYHDWRALLLQAARNVVDKLGKQPGGLAARTWGEVNHAQIKQPLARALPGFIARFLNMPDDELPGDHNMPRVAAPGFGASERFDVAPGHEDEGILEMPGGQSDNPLSPFYGAGHRDWVEGRPTRLMPGSDRHTLILQPASS
ncbi:penicillin acylase family protein [Dyella mobilis]|uniref:Penicillin acylase family protein n=1 Tax=Dyella mobilis TaxID=1849582 RepID=A0ABS2KI23_9GAMM|nr:penicillin acylase family protein [Dyella mobilis]MBM7130540.1 penicillin acylase family protein [Dyella mobilis]GLQ97167.1 penicillin acylase [Dyella mobilis]